MCSKISCQDQPGRWIGDNVLCHLEEVEYLQQTGRPGCMVFLDISKAYDRFSRPWVLDCMSSMGFGECACKWVSIMLQNTSATGDFLFFFFGVQGNCPPSVR